MKGFQTICDQVLIASINGIWQGIILTVLVALGLRVMSRTNAATRHGVLFFTLFMVVLLLGVHWARLVLPFPQPEHERNNRSDSLALKTVKINPAEEPPNVPPQASAGNTSGNSTEERTEPQISTITELDNLLRSQISSADFKTAPEPNSSGASSYIQRAHSFGLADRVINPLRVGLRIPVRLSVFLLSLWVAICGIKMVVLVFRLRQIRKLKLDSELPNDELNLIFKSIREQLGVRRNVQFRISRGSPILLGFINPVILLPPQSDQPDDRAGFEQVLRHELAHVRRYDDWANLLQQLVHTVFFFHPALGWICRRLSLEREIACDDQVIEQSGRRQYALLLVNLAGRLQGRRYALAPGTSGNKNQLKQRINMVLNDSRNRSPYLAKTTAGLMTTAVTVLALAASCCAPRVILAQNEPGQPPEGLRTPVEPFRPARPLDSNAPAPILGDIPMIAGQPGQPQPPRRPRAPMSPEFAPGERPLEQRLARVERMLEMLMSHFDLNPGQADFQAKERMEQEARRREKMRAERNLRPDSEEAERKFKESMESDALNEKERQFRNAAARAMKQEMERQSQLSPKERMQNQLQMLRKHLEMLEREKGKLGEQIEKLQKEQEKLDEGARGKSGDKE